MSESEQIDLDSIMSEALLERESKNEDFDVDEFVKELESDDGQNEEVEERRSKETRIRSLFRHSKYGILLIGAHKGKEIEVKYYIPGKLELEVGVNEEIISKEELKNGQVVNECVVLSKIDKNRYLGHCRKVAFLDEKDVMFDGDVVEIIRGPLFGMQGSIRNIHKTRVGIIVDGLPLTVETDQIFYKDLLLKNGKYFHVIHIDLDNDNYVIDGVELGGKEIVRITLDDVSEMVSGFKLGKEIEKFDVEIQEDDGYSLRDSDSVSSNSDGEMDSDDNKSQSSLDITDDLDSNSVLGEDDVLEKSTFRDLERTSRVFSGWTKEQKRYLDLIKKLLKNIKKNDDILNVFGLIDKIESILNSFDKEIERSGENFDIYSSSIDLQMVIACCVAYDLVNMGEFGFSNFTNYINSLYSAGYFSGSVVSSVLVELPEVFVCNELKRTKIAFERVKMLMLCFNRLIQEMLGINIDFDIRRESSTLEYEKVIRKEKIHDKRGFILPEDVINDINIDVSKKILWSPIYIDRINKWRKRIVEKVNTSSGITKRVYDFIEKNIEMSPIVLLKLRDQVKLFLLNKNDKLLSECGGKKVCENEKMMSEVNIILQDVSNGSINISELDYELLHKYVRMNDFVKKFFQDIAVFITYNKSKKEQRLEQVRLEKERTLEKRKSIQVESITREKITNILKNKLNEKFDEMCLDNSCKMRELMDKVRRVLRTQEQMLLEKAEVELLRQFVDDYGEIYPVIEKKKIPKIILRLSKKE
jgi:hypothetical protein